MPIGLLALTSIPLTIGTLNGVRAARNPHAADSPAKLAARGTDITLRIHCTSRSRHTSQLHGKTALFHSGKMFVGTPGSDAGHPFDGFFLPYPGDDPKPWGLVSLTSADPPALGFVFADSETGEVRYGNRSASLGQVVGSWDWSGEGEEDGEGGWMSLQGREGFWALEEEGERRWAVWFDVLGDARGLPLGRRGLPVRLERVVLDRKKGEKDEKEEEEKG